MRIKLFNKVLIILLLLLTCILVPLKSNAVSDMFDSANKFLAAGESPSSVIDETKLQSTSNTIYKWLMVIAICVAVIIGAILGVLFITGSIEGKAKIQEALAPYIIGCFVVFGAFFMATDYATSPITSKGQIIFGIILGLLTGLFRFFGTSAEGVSYAIIISNLLVPLIEKLTLPTPFGKEGVKDEK